jgi:predicted 2-oxoglutarate/Fe(II)-dependent dioxygenase YbiX
MVLFEKVILTEDDCANIVKSIHEWTTAGLYSQKGDSYVTVVNSHKRNTLASFISLKNQSILHSKINGALNEIGYKFITDNIDGNILKYEKDCFIYKHHDLPIEGVKRIFCVIVQLNDSTKYIGGDFKYYPNNNEFKMGRTIGNCLIFKPELLHEVTLVEQGERYSLVVWVNYEDIEKLSTKRSLI